MFARRLLILMVLATATLGSVTAPAATTAPAPTHWCGDAEATQDRLPDAVASYQIHVVYAIPSDGSDQFTQLALPLVRDLASIDSWWLLQDSSRAPRYDLASFPGCDSVFGALDISVVRLSQPGSAYSSFQLDARNAFLGAVTAAIGSIDTGKKYLTFYGGPVDPGSGVCGFSSRGPTTSGGSVSVVLLGASPGVGLTCGTPGSADYFAKTTAHELLHNLGAVPDEAPHVCNSGHVCDDRDIMTSGGIANSLFNYALDVGHDDYYGHSGTWWDVQDSPFLAHVTAPQYQLTVSIDGPNGTVESDLPGISCPPACSIPWESGSEVILTPEETAKGTHFAGWSGACSADTCVLTMDGPKAVTARFVRSVNLHLGVSNRGGTGEITGPGGIACDEQCDFEVDQGSSVTLKAVPDRQSRLLAWSVATCGTRPTCTVKADADKTVRATFGPGSARLTVRVSGRGRVTSTPAGLACPRTCSRAFPVGRTVRLTARPGRGWELVSWGGACHGARACTVKLTKAALVRATFRRSG
jgi:List-Bact-rpt repeat protein